MFAKAVRSRKGTWEPKSARRKREEPPDWRGVRMAALREIILKADPAAIEEVKWRKPSRPEGVPVWSHDGIICVGDTLKAAVRLTFPKGAQIRDSKKLFNARLDSRTVRAIDVREDDRVDEMALRHIVQEGVVLNAARASKR